MGGSVGREHIELQFSRRGLQFLSKLLSGKVKFFWKIPDKADVVIWDEVGSDVLSRSLHFSSYYVLRVRDNPFCMHPRVLFWTLLSLWSGSGSGSQSSAIIRICAPRLVVTFIHNDINFHRLSCDFPKTRFLAIQNGMFGIGHTDEPYLNKSPGKYCSEFLVWGTREVVELEQEGYQFKKVSIMGSLKSTAQLEHSSSTSDGTKMVVKYDLLLLSQFRINLLWDDPGECLLEYRALVFLVQQLMRSYPDVRIGIAMSTAWGHEHHQKEASFHQEILGNSAQLLPKSSDGYSAYYHLDSAGLVVSSCSSLAFESLGRKHKTLITSQTFYNRYSTKLSMSDWVIDGFSAAIFNAKVFELLAMEKIDFATRNRESTSYFIVSGDQVRLRDFVTAIRPKTF